MFVTFSMQKKPEAENGWQRIWRQLFEIWQPSRTTIQRIPLYGSFFTDIRIGARLCADAEQERQLRQCCRRALCAEGCALPVGFCPAVCEADIRRMLARILCNTATEILKSSGLPLYCRCIALIDPDCAYGALLEPLIKHVPDVLVYTENHRLYQGYAKKLMEEYGAPVQFAENLQVLSRACLILDTAGSALPCLYPVPVLSVSPDRVEDKNLRLWQPEWLLPPAQAVIPPGIDRYAFFAALRKCCGIREIDRLCARSLRCKEREVSPCDIAEKVFRNQSRALRVR